MSLFINVIFSVFRNNGCPPIASDHTRYTNSDQGTRI